VVGRLVVALCAGEERAAAGKAKRDDIQLGAPVSAPALTVELEPPHSVSMNDPLLHRSGIVLTFQD
jgi:hypothetical protein